MVKVPLYDSVCSFMPFWVELLPLPLEYRDLNIVEAIAIKIDKFICHDLNPHEELDWAIRVCLLLDTLKPFSNFTTLQSKWCSWRQQIII